MHRGGGVRDGKVSGLLEAQRASPRPSSGRRRRVCDVFRTSWFTMVTTRFDSTILDERWRPLAYVTVHDTGVRSRILDVLEGAGWTTIVQPTGIHLIDALAGLIDGNAAWRRPGLIVVDAYPRGCAGITIATGLRDLGVAIPTVLLATPGARLGVTPDASLHVVDPATAAAFIAELVRAPPHESEPRRPAA